MLDLSKMYTYGTVNFIFVEIQPYSTNIKNDHRMSISHSKIELPHVSFKTVVSEFLIKLVHV